MAPNVTAAAAHIAYDMQPPESLHRTKYQIKAKKNQDLEHTELEMLITVNVHIPLPNPASTMNALSHFLTLPAQAQHLSDAVTNPNPASAGTAP